MINAWFYYVLPLGTSIFLVTVAIVTLRKSIRGDLHAKGKPYGLGTGCGSILAAGIGGSLGLAILLSPTPWQRQRLFNHVFHTPPEPSNDSSSCRPAKTKSSLLLGPRS